jgi:membrane fusion protein (multidrug efflux system)
MNKNRGFTPLAAVLMLSGSLVLTGCNDKETKQSAPHTPEVGVVTLKSAPLQITTELPGRTSAYRIAEVRPQVSGIILKRNFV